MLRNFNSHCLHFIYCHYSELSQTICFFVLVLIRLPASVQAPQLFPQHTERKLPGCENISDELRILPCLRLNCQSSLSPVLQIATIYSCSKIRRKKKSICCEIGQRLPSTWQETGRSSRSSSVRRHKQNAINSLIV